MNRRWYLHLILAGLAGCVAPGGPAAADTVRLFTHTLAPAAWPGGGAQYGCTEFVFSVDPEVIQHADGAADGRTIERWLARVG